MVFQNLAAFSTLILFLSSSLLPLSAATALSSGPDPPARRCKCLYDQPCWPSPAAFASLAQSVSQPLIRPVPIGSVCYPSFPPPFSGNSAVGNSTCEDVQSKSKNAQWRTDQPGGYQNVQFEGHIHAAANGNVTIDRCLVPSPSPSSEDSECLQGSVPPIGVDARTPSDVQAAVRFAAKHNLRLVIKNTGHDYLGRSAGKGAFLVWVHNMKERSFDPSFVPEGSKDGEYFQAVTLGAGVQWHEAYDLVHEHNRVVVGGLTAGGTVGTTGGWVQGGGHSVLTTNFGLGVDNALQFTIVLSSGQHVTTNAYRYPDLFWALRGGGGGTWGVVTSVTYKTHPEFPVVYTALALNFTSKAVEKAFLEEWIAFHPQAADAKWGGYGLANGPTFTSFFLKPNGTLPDAARFFAPFVDRVRAATGLEPQFVQIPLGSYYAFVQQFFSPEEVDEEVGINTELATRLISEETMREDAGGVAEVLAGLGGDYLSVLVGGAARTFPSSSAALNPAWRKANSVMIIGDQLPANASGTEILAMRKKLGERVAVLDTLTRDSGSYFNEATLAEKDFKKSFFGSHYPKLRAIKRKYDPTDLFIVPLGVGSEGWKADSVCRV